MSSIRKAEAEDVVELAELFEAYRAFYKQVPNPAGARDFLKQRFERGDSTMFVATEEGTIIGFVQLYPLLDSLKLGNLWLLNDLYASSAAKRPFKLRYVDPSRRGTGIGKRLLARAKVLAEETNATGLLLETQKTNKIGNSLYPSQGWKFDDEFNYYFWTREAFESGTKDGQHTGLVRGQ